MSKVKKIIAIIVCVVCIFATFCFSTSAITINNEYNTISSPLSQPSVSDNFGYVEIVCRDYSTGSVRGYVFLVTFNAVTSGESICEIEFPSDKKILFRNLSDGIMAVSCVTSEGLYHSQGISYTIGQVLQESFDYSIVSIKYYGCIHSIEAHKYNAISFSTIYSGDNAGIILLETVVSLLRSNANTINQQIQNDNTNANNIQQNQNDNTDKIIENQQQIQENEKNEAESSGQGSVDDVSGAIEDKSAGFISAISNLVGSMSYNGTACAWSFPAIKLPAIEGVMPEYQLTDEKPIDFEFWVNKIPANILLLVRSLLTIALIGYCFKELYSTISYVLTLKGGGNNE